MGMTKSELAENSRKKTDHKAEQKARQAKREAKAAQVPPKKGPSIRKPTAAELQMMFTYVAIMTLAASAGAAALSHPAAAQADDDHSAEYQPIGPQDAAPPMTDAANDHAAAKWVDSIKREGGTVNIVVGDRPGCVAAMDYFQSMVNYVANNGKKSFPNAIATIKPLEDDRKSEYHKDTNFYATGTGAFNVLADRGNHPNLAAGLVDMNTEQTVQTMFGDGTIDPEGLNTTLHHVKKANVYVVTQDGAFSAKDPSASIDQIVKAAEQAKAEGENAALAIEALPDTPAVTIVITKDASSDALKQAIEEKSQRGSKTWAVYGDWSNPAPDVMSEAENDFFQMTRDLIVSTINDQEWKGPDDSYEVESPYSGTTMQFTVVNNTVTATDLMVGDQVIPFDRNETKEGVEEKKSVAENKWAKNKNSYTSNPNTTAEQVLEPTASLTEPEKKSWLNLTQIKEEATRAIKPYMKNPFNLSSYVPR